MLCIEKSRELLGTQFSICVVGGPEFTRERIEEAFEIVKEFENNYSRFIGENKLSDLNGNLNKWIQVDDDVYNLLNLGRKLFVQTDGAFNLCVKNILEDLGYDRKYSFIPNERNFEVGSLELRDGKVVRFSSELDFGALGKGYVVDLLCDFFSDFENFCINAGGDLFAKGVDEAGRIWRAGFENPLNLSQVIGIVEVDGFALASSSGNRRFWGGDDKFHHLLDANSGKSQKEMLAVFTQSKSAFLADAYSTALFVVGFDKAVDILEQEIEVEGMLMDIDGRIYRSKGFRGELFMK